MQPPRAARRTHERKLRHAVQSSPVSEQALSSLHLDLNCRKARVFSRTRFRLHVAPCRGRKNSCGLLCSQDTQRMSAACATTLRVQRKTCRSRRFRCCAGCHRRLLAIARALPTRTQTLDAGTGRPARRRGCRGTRFGDAVGGRRFGRRCSRGGVAVTAPGALPAPSSNVPRPECCGSNVRLVCVEVRPACVDSAF